MNENGHMTVESCESCPFFEKEERKETDEMTGLDGNRCEAPTKNTYSRVDIKNPADKPPDSCPLPVTVGCDYELYVVLTGGRSPTLAYSLGYWDDEEFKNEIVKVVQINFPKEDPNDWTKGEIKRDSWPIEQLSKFTDIEMFHPYLKEGDWIPITYMNLIDDE